MIKHWIINLRIRRKLNLMTLIAVLSLVLMGITARYFFNTSKVLGIIFNAERMHTLNFQGGVAHFYKYINTGDSSMLETAISSISKADMMAHSFGISGDLSRNETFSKQSDLYYEYLEEAFESDKSNADLMTSRVRLLLWIGNEDINKSINVAEHGYENGEKIIRLIKLYSKQPDNANLKEIESTIEATNQLYREFAASIQNVVAYANNLLLWGILLTTLILSIIIIIMSGLISGIITSSITSIINSFKQIAQGNINVPVEVVSKDEVGQLAESFNELQQNLKYLVTQTNQVAKGDYSVVIAPRSDQDEFSIALASMIVALGNAEKLAHIQNWLKTGQNELNEKLRGDQNEDELSNAVADYLATYLGAQIATVYLKVEEKNELMLSGSYAFIKRKSLNDSFKLGEGLVGQAAKSLQMISVTKLPDDYTRITSSTGDAAPRNVIVLPLVHNRQLAGVVELASIEVMSDQKIEFLNNVAETIAISLLSARSRKRLAELLDKTQLQAEELQAQQEELRVSNEELEEQTHALRERESELQAQQEELRVINEELEANASSLEFQKKEISQKNNELGKAKEILEIKARELEITSKYKSEFLANMSHELRTPLNSLLILSKNLLQNKKGNLLNDQLESIEIIRNSGDDLLRLINEILDLSKIESGKMTFTIEPVSIEKLKANILRNFSHHCEEKGLAFEVTTAADVPAIIDTDTQRLEQVVKNLMSNAIKFTAAGSINVEFSLPKSTIKFNRQDLLPDQTIAISVKDTGIGIPREKQLLIFEAFQQADGSTSRHYGGTGLGLSISKEIVKILGGEIQLNSQQGSGSEFIIYLPLKSKSKPSSDYHEVSDEKPKPALVIANHELIQASMYISKLADDRKSINEEKPIILVIEDDENFARILRDACHEKGFDFLYAPTGESGLKLAEEFKPGAIILDIKLPGIDGYTVLDLIKRNPALRHIPVHMMSAMEESLDVYRKGAIGFLSKPATPEKLEQALQSIGSFVSRKVSELLIVEDNQILSKQIADIIGKGDVNTVTTGSGLQAIEILKSKHFDCVVLDLGLPDISGFDLLARMHDEFKTNMPPVIVYTGRELSIEENNRLKKYAESIIVKGVKSEDRLLDETALFLHRVVKNLPPQKQEIIATLHSKDATLVGKKVLIVDDDMRNLFALSKVLDEKGMVIREAENGKTALEIIDKETDIDIILMDIMMPVMDGYETMKQIRKKPRYTKLPVIALTAKAMKDDYDKCLESGASDYLSKPLDIERLISLMNVWLYK